MNSPIKILKREKAIRFVVNSASDARRRYVVSRATSQWKCSCPRWIYGVKQKDGSRRRMDCKHISAVQTMVGQFGSCAMNANILAVPPTNRRQAFFLLNRVMRHVLNSGKRGFARLDNPQAVRLILHDVMAKVRVASTKTSRRDIVALQKMPRRKRRVQYRHTVTVYKNSTVPALRHALPAMHGQGFLKRDIAVHPYRAMDTFMRGHRVNIYKHGQRFDVIDALCNLPILAGVSRVGLKKVVDLSAPLPTTVYRGQVSLW